MNINENTVSYFFAICALFIIDFPKAIPNIYCCIHHIYVSPSLIDTVWKNEYCIQVHTVGIEEK